MPSGSIRLVCVQDIFSYLFFFNVKILTLKSSVLHAEIAF